MKMVASLKTGRTIAYAGWHRNQSHGPVQWGLLAASLTGLQLPLVSVLGRTGLALSTHWFPEEGGQNKVNNYLSEA